jgi:hypothetical protein
MGKYCISVFFFSLLFGGIGVADAHVPNMVHPESETDITVIEDPNLSQAFYGELINFPHTYEISSEEPFLLKVEVLAPDIKSSENIYSGIIVKMPEGKGRVTEITRLKAGDASWESKYEPFGGDSYRHGPSYETEVAAGTYRIEVHTPDNIGKYVLVVGAREEMSIGYFEMLGRIIEVKRFFEKTPLLVVQSPFYYVPLGLILIVYFLYRRTKNS